MRVSVPLFPLFEPARAPSFPSPRASLKSARAEASPLFLFGALCVLFPPPRLLAPLRLPLPDLLLVLDAPLLAELLLQLAVERVALAGSPSPRQTKRLAQIFHLLLFPLRHRVRVVLPHRLALGALGVALELGALLLQALGNLGLGHALLLQVILKLHQLRFDVALAVVLENRLVRLARALGAGVQGLEVLPFLTAQARTRAVKLVAGDVPAGAGTARGLQTHAVVRHGGGAPLDLRRESARRGKPASGFTNRTVKCDLWGRTRDDLTLGGARAKLSAARRKGDATANSTRKISRVRLSPRDGRVRWTERAAALCRDATSDLKTTTAPDPLRARSKYPSSPESGAQRAQCRRGLSARPSSPRSCAGTRSATP